MDSKQKWNRIVELHKQYYKSPETTIQNVWENICVEILGFSRLDGEVDRHRNIYLGSTERVIPDVIVKDSKKDLFVIELKLHNAVFEDGMRRQLFSYLKQLKVNVGVLVCEKLYIYGYDYSKQDSEQLCVEIPFEEDSVDGEKFVELFCKAGFSEAPSKLPIMRRSRPLRAARIKFRLARISFPRVILRTRMASLRSNCFKVSDAPSI